MAAVLDGDELCSIRDDSMEITRISGALRSTIAFAMRILSIAVAALDTVAPCWSALPSAVRTDDFREEAGVEGTDVKLFK